MYCKFFLVGSASSGKSTLVNTLSQKFAAYTDVEITRFKDGNNFKTYKFTKENKPERYHLENDSVFDSLEITDTQGIDSNNTISQEYIDKITNFSSGDTTEENIKYSNTIVYMIDASGIWRDTYLRHIESINDIITKYTHTDFYVIFNKCEQATLDIDKRVQLIHNNINSFIKCIKMSCYMTFLSSVAGKNYILKLYDYKMSEIHKIIRSCGYSRTKRISEGLDRKELLCKHLRKKGNDLEEDDNDNDNKLDDIHDFIKDTNSGQTKRKLNKQHIELENILNNETYDHVNMLRCLALINKLNNNNIDNVNKLESIIENDIEKKILISNDTELKNEYLLKIQSEFNYEFISKLVLKYKDRLEYDILFSSYIHNLTKNMTQYNNGICDILIKDNRIFSEDKIDKISKIDISDSAKYYLNVLNTSVLDIEIMINMNAIDYNRLDKYLEDSKLKLNYMVKLPIDKNEKLYVCKDMLSSEKKDQYNDFVKKYKKIYEYMEHNRENQYNDDMSSISNDNDSLISLPECNVNTQNIYIDNDDNSSIDNENNNPMTKLDVHVTNKNRRSSHRHRQKYYGNRLPNC